VSDQLDAIAPPHEPVNVSREMAEATGEHKASEPARVTRPANEHQVDKIAKRSTRPAEG
jgi:hypothetical protein